MSVVINGTDGITFNDGSLQPSAIGKNIVINGDMQIAQRGTSSSSYSTGDTYLTLDRWRSNIGTAGTWTMSQDTDVPTGEGFATSMKWDCTTANASLSTGSAFGVSQYLEGFNVQSLAKGTANAKSTTLSFWVKSNKTGTYIADLFDVDTASYRYISKSYTINTADTWEKKTITFAGDTTGPLDNDNARSLDLRFWLVAGTDYTSGTLQTSWGTNVASNRAVGQVNLADSTANYINITGVQLEVGTTATPFENLMYSQQLAMCQRYYQSIGRALFRQYTQNTGFPQHPMLYGTTMRATPTSTLSISSSANIDDATLVTYSGTSAYLSINPTAAGVVFIDYTMTLNAEL